MFTHRSISRALAVAAIGGAGLAVAPSLASAEQQPAVVVEAAPAPADHLEPPGSSDGLTIGACHVRASSGWLGAPCVGGRRPYLAAYEFGGATRDETADKIAELYLAGWFKPGTVFVSRWEDRSAARITARLTGGTAVLVNGGAGPLDDASRARLIAAHNADPAPGALVFIGGDEAINVGQRIEIAWLVWGGA